MKILAVALLILSFWSPLDAASTPKLQLLYVEMEHCPWCHRMEQEVFSDPETLATLQQHYVIKKIEKSRDKLPLNLKPRFFPTTYILSADGSKLVDELPGYMERDHFVDYLKDLWDVETQETDQQP